MRMMKRWLIAGTYLVVLIVAGVVSGSARTAQPEPTAAGRLGGGAPLDATAPVSTLPPTATAASTVSPTTAASPVASPAGSPIAGKAIVPVDCTVAPRSLDEVAALLMLSEPPPAPRVPTADAWTPDAQAAAKAVVAELVACGNAGNQLTAYALLTDAALIDYLIGRQPGVGTIRPLFFDETAALVPALVTGLETRAGEPGVVYLWLDRGSGKAVTARVTVAGEGGAWRIAGIEVAKPGA